MYNNLSNKTPLAIVFLPGENGKWIKLSGKFPLLAYGVKFDDIPYTYSKYGTITFNGEMDIMSREEFTPPCLPPAINYTEWEQMVLNGVQI